MKYTIDKSVTELGITNPVLFIIHGISKIKDTPKGVADEGKIVLKEINNNIENHLAKPEVTGFNEVFSKMGYENVIPAGERLVRTFSEKGMKSYGPIIDSYNITAMKYSAGIGMHDASKNQKSEYGC